MSRRNDLSVSHLCKLAGVSRSGYYEWVARPVKPVSSDEKYIIRLFYDKKELFGYRRLKMEFDRKNLRVMNLKKVRRIKRDFGLIAKIRKPNKYRATKSTDLEHCVAPNFVNRDFLNRDAMIISIDLTEMKIRSGQKVWFFAAKKTRTKEVVAWAMGTRPSMDIVTRALEKYLKSMDEGQRKKIIIHSDQGTHFTSKEFRDLLGKYEIKQSMSRKGNCLDNAPIESFFGHLKDEIDYKSCRKPCDLEKDLNRYVKYYNNDRPQWGLKRKTPAEAGVYASLVF